MNVLDTGIKEVKNVAKYTIGEGSLNDLPKFLNQKRIEKSQPILFFLDEFFKNREEVIAKLGLVSSDRLIFVSTKAEPTTDYIDDIIESVKNCNFNQPSVIVGMGGGTTMDVAKAVSNLLTNGGKAEDYQGWDLVSLPGIFKIAIPTISGTGAEATRTCVMTNTKTGLKLGMNSDHTVFDQIIMDPLLTATVPRDQYFYTGMDAYIHCIEALSGSHRNAIGDSFSKETISLCKQIFLNGDMQTPKNRERLMVASYLGGCAIATSYVGLVHPLSAGLSVVFGLHHCVANCIVMRAMEEYYPKPFQEFWEMAEKQKIKIPKGICNGLDEAGFKALYEASTKHEKPLTNALGKDYKAQLTLEKITKLYKKM